MNLPDELMDGLKALSPAEVRQATAYIRSLRGKESRRTRAGSDPVDLFVSVEAADLRIVHCDQAFASMAGGSPLGKRFLELIDAEYRDAAAQVLEIVRARKETRNVRLRLLRANGGSLPVTMAARWIEGDAGRPDAIDIVCGDISNLKRIGNLEIFSEMLSIGIALVDENARIVFANSAAERLFGYAHGELEQQPWEALFPDTHLNFGAEREAERELHGRTKAGGDIALKIGWSSIRVAERRFAIASMADMTARKSIEGALRKHEEQRALIFSEGVLGDFTWNMERDEVDAHPTVYRLYGAAPVAGPVPGEWFRSRQHPDDRLATERTWMEQITTGQELVVEFRVNGDDGVLRWIDCRGIVVKDKEGVAREVHGINIDISARKRAEMERHESEERALRAEELLSTALQYSNTVVWRWNIDEDKLEWWGKVKEVYGVDAADLGNAAGFRKVVFPNDVAGVQEAIARNRASGSDLQHEFRIVRPDGEIRWIASRAGMLRDEQGHVYGMAGVNFDVTNRRTAEEERKQSDRDFRELTNVIPQIVFRTNALGAIDYRNQRYFEISGFTSEAEAAARWAEVLKPDERERTMEVWREGIASGRPFQLEFQLYDRRLEQYRWYLARTVPVHGAEGETVRWIGTSTDIHDQKTAAERLESEVQSRTMDLKQSLTLLRQREEQLEKSLLEKEAMLREIHHRVKNNLQIVSSLLSMQASNANSAAAAPLRDSERRIASMAMIHEQLYGTEDLQTIEFAEHASRLSQSLLASMVGNAPIGCRLDLQPVSLSIHQAIPCALILNELLTNAIKYAYPNHREGEIIVHLSREEGVVNMTVSDQGVGLPPEVDPFRLEIIQVLVEQLQGELTVAGSPGASFSVTFRPQEERSQPDLLPAGASIANRQQPSL